MAQIKTRQNDKSVDDFMSQIDIEKRRQDCFTILKFMKKITGSEPKMRGDSIVGFGNYHYKYASGREGDWFLTGFSPRKQSLILYIMSGFGKYAELLEELGKFKTGKSCLCTKNLEDIDMPTLKELINQSISNFTQ